MIRFVANMGNALVTAFGTASSSASLPVTINSLEQKNHIDPRISRYSTATVHRKKTFSIFPSPAGMSITERVF
jgi:Na+/H+-dicarboxylate symporter